MSPIPPLLRWTGKLGGSKPAVFHSNFVTVEGTYVSDVGWWVVSTAPPLLGQVTPTTHVGCHLGVLYLLLKGWDLSQNCQCTVLVITVP